MSAPPLDGIGPFGGTDNPRLNPSRELATCVPESDKSATDRERPSKEVKPNREFANVQGLPQRLLVGVPQTNYGADFVVKPDFVAH